MVARQPWPAQSLPRRVERLASGIRECRCWRGSRQLPGGGTRLDQARAPDHASVAYRSGTWLLLINVIGLIVSKLVAVIVARRQAKLAHLVAHRPQAYFQQLRRSRPVAAGRFERHGKKLALHLFEREASLPLRRMAGQREREFFRKAFFRKALCPKASRRQNLPRKIFTVFERFDANLAAARQRYSAPHEVCQLANIAWPGLLFKPAHQLAR